MSRQYKNVLFHGTISVIDKIDVTKDIGPTADDDTLLCLRSYWNGLYGSVGSADAKQILLRNLEPDNLGVQYYIGNQDIVNDLVESCSEVD